ncbi:MAG TPA: hypothetical protein VIM69_10520 [Opitutaceae bacterium]
MTFLSDLYLLIIAGAGLGLAMCVILIFILAALDFIYRLSKGDFL